MTKPWPEYLADVEARANAATPGPCLFGVTDEEYAIADRNGGLAKLIYDMQCRYVGPRHEEASIRTINKGIAASRIDVPLPQTQGGRVTCLNCYGLIMEQGKTYGYAGKVCLCPIDPQRVYQRPSGATFQPAKETILPNAEPEAEKIVSKKETQPAGKYRKRIDELEEENARLKDKQLTEAEHRCIESWKREELLWLEQEKELKADNARLLSELRTVTFDCAKCELELAALKKEIAEAPVLRGIPRPETGIWFQGFHFHQRGDTHTCRAVRIEEIKK